MRNPFLKPTNSAALRLGYVTYFILLVCVHCPVLGQKGNAYYKKIELPETHAYTEVFTILKDRKGFMWFGTTQGLFRYDGIGFKHYTHHHGDFSTLSDDSIVALMEDKQGKIWVGTNTGGISLLDPKTESFKQYRTIAGDSTSIPNNNVRTFFQDKEGHIWVGTGGGGLCRYLPDTDTFQRYGLKRDTSKGLSHSFVTKIIQDDHGLLWIGLNGGGVDRLDTKTGLFQNYRIEKLGNTTANFRNNVVRDLYDDDQGNLWLATYGGLNRLDKREGTFTHYGVGNSMLRTNSLNSFFEKDNRLRITSFDGYIYEFDTNNSDFVAVERIDYGIRCSYFGAKGHEWYGFSGNSVLLRIHASDFPFYPLETTNSVVTSILQTPENIYFGTSHGGIFNGRHEKIPFDSSLFPATGGVENLATGPENILWMATDSGGCHRYDTKTGALTTFRYDANDPTSLPHDTVFKIYHDQFGTVWVCTSAGLAQWLPESKSFLKRGGTGFYDVLRIAEDELWTGTAIGIAVSDPINDTFYMKQADPLQKKDSILHNQVNTLFSPDRDSILIGTRKGLNIYKRSTGKMLNVHSYMNLPYNDIKSITQDQHKNYWLLTNHGILQVDLSRKAYKFYDKTDGFDTSNRNSALFFDKKNQQLYVGGKNGYYKFTPKSLEFSAIPIPVLTEGLKIFNKPLSDYGYLDKIEDGESYLFSHDHNMVSFDYTAFNYRHPDRINYAYRLKGLDDDWVFTKERTASFTNLKSGNYVFEVKATNNDGIWNDDPAQVHFRVNPPFWATWWAYLSYGILAVLLIYTLSRAFVRREQLKSRLKLERLEMEKVMELNQLKSNFFANISHEFRTPLTLIKGPVEDLKESQLPKGLQRNLDIVQRNTKRLKRLIDQLLDFSKLESHTLTLDKQKGSPIGLLKAIIPSFESLAISKAITYSADIPQKEYLAHFDADKLETIVYNLISNALKFTPEGGTVKVVAKILKNQDKEGLELKVSDTGPGLEGAQKERVFERFYQIKGKQNKGGMGIGLAMSKELVNLMQGKIHVASTPGKETCFTVFIPIRWEAEVGTEVLKEKPLDFKTIEAPERKPKTAAQNAQKVLLVEDNEDMRAYVRAILEPHFQVLEAQDGEVGLEKAFTEIPDMIISDYMMPNMEGDVLCKMLKQDERSSHIPFLMLTAKASEEDKLEGLEIGADDYLVKPFNKKELLLKIKNRMEKRKRLQARILDDLGKPSSKEKLISQEERFLHRFKALLYQHLDKSDLSIEFLAGEIGLSRVQLYRKILALTGLPTSDFVRKIRVQKASELLQNRWGSVSQVAYAVGFNNLSYFSKSFRDVYGKSPSQFVKDLK